VVVDTLIDAIRAPYGALMAVMGVCGLRWGEAVALRRKHVDGLRRRLIVEESLAEINGTLIFGDTKSHARRSVPVSPRVMALLDVALAGKGRDALVFTAAEGGPVRYRNFLSRVWHPLLERLELPQVGVHVLRHSAAARIISVGGSHKTLQTVLGHRSAAFSLTVYGHLFDADLDALADRLDTPTERKAL
jgi:integrase